MKASHYRKQFFLWKSSQPRLLAGIELIFAILLLIAGAVFAMIANRDLTASYLKAHLSIRNMLDILIPTLIGINLLGLSISVILAVFFTHRIAGPVYRLCRILKEIGQGNLAQTIRFRRGDELKELDEAATEMIAGLQGRARTLQLLSAELICQMNAVYANADQSTVRVMREKARELDDQLAGFHLPSANS
ncbi:MAG: hypothetical protein HZB19_06735 [Chloroflexi bacterium]|nr:hypothetical protein [Chloroflexota bacterium]